MTELAKINEENSVSSRSESVKEDQSPKILVGIQDTWGNENSKLDDTCNEIMNDFNALELNYKLRENWLETNNSIDKPFDVELSVIQAKIKRKENKEA